MALVRKTGSGPAAGRASPPRCPDRRPASLPGHDRAAIDRSGVGPARTRPPLTWTTEYLGLAVDMLRADGREIPDELLAHISPARTENIGF
jgi:hypothetical protein